MLIASSNIRLVIHFYFSRFQEETTELENGINPAGHGGSHGGSHGGHGGGGGGGKK